MDYSIFIRAINIWFKTTLKELDKKEEKNEIVGVIGAGSFGTAISNLLSYNVDVLLYSRRPELVNKINSDHRHFNLKLSKRVRATNDLKEIADNCNLIFPIVPSTGFRGMIKKLAPFLRPYHILIH